MTISHYLNNMPMLTNQWTVYNYKEPTRQRIYLKDIDCPPVWHEKLRELIPPLLFYLNDSTGDAGGPGAKLEPNPHGAGDKARKGDCKGRRLNEQSSTGDEGRQFNVLYRP
jgi:hypothetical protein